MSYRDALVAVADQTEAGAEALYAAWKGGDLTDDQFEVLLAALIARANGRAAAIADLALAATITVALRRPVAPLGILPAASDAERLPKATRTLRAALADTPDPPARVARLGRSEPLTTAARAYSDGMRTSPHVTGWTRGLSGNACELCQWWAADGRVWPDDHEMPTHKGCACTPIPTTTE